MHRILSGCEQRLIERNGNDLMLAMIADIGGAEEPAVGGLILKIESPVLRVRELVVDIVTAEQERPEQVSGGKLAGFGLRDVGKQRLEGRGAATPAEAGGEWC